MQEKRNQPIVELLNSLQIDERLENILLYALGMINQR